MNIIILLRYIIYRNSNFMSKFRTTITTLYFNNFYKIRFRVSQKLAVYVTDLIFFKYSL